MTDAPLCTDLVNRLRPTCPHCHHMMTDDEMHAMCDRDIYDLAPCEEIAPLDCPRCARVFWVKGSYVPQYTTAVHEEDL